MGTVPSTSLSSEAGVDERVDTDDNQRNGEWSNMFLRSFDTYHTDMGSVFLQECSITLERLEGRA